MAGELVERLRKVSRVLREYGWGSEMVSPPDEAADRIEALERELADERDESMWRFWRDKTTQLAAENATLRAEKEAEHQQFLKMGNMYVQKCVEMAGARKQAFEEAAQVADNYLPSTFDATAIAAAIRNMGGEG